MSRKGTITVEASVDVDVDEVLDHASTEALEQELADRGNGARHGDEDDPVLRIWIRVMRYGLSLDDAVADVMRERGYTWRLPKESA